MNGSPGALAEGARLRRSLSLPRPRVPLLTGLGAALGPACRLRRRYAHAPAGAISVAAMRPLRTPESTFEARRIPVCKTKNCDCLKVRMPFGRWVNADITLVTWRGLPHTGSYQAL